MKTRIKFLLILFFGSFFMQAQISLKDDNSETKRIIGGQTEQKAVTDQVILDDLIVDGSACIGIDCVNGESFGFDTIRLKENNLRIRAVDTSSSASFPTNDWQITFNDSSNGGANKFSIDDIDGGRTPFTIEASAPSHSLYVDDGGRIGLGTSTPVVQLHEKDGDTPTLRLEQDGTSGFGPQTWDIAGNETNFFIRDASNSSTLPFRLRPGAPSNSIYIDTDGDIGLGTASPKGPLDVFGGSPSSSLFVVKEDGNIGIGVEAPVAKLEIDQDNVAVGLEVKGGASGIDIVKFSRDVGANTTVGINGSSAQAQLYLATNNNTFSMGVANTTFKISDNAVLGVNDRFAIDNLGNVGIGTVNPSNKLEVIGNTRIDGNLIVTGTITATPGGVNTIPDDGDNIYGSEKNPFPELYVSGNSSFTDVSYFEKDIYVKGSIMPGSIYGPSDAAIKDNVKPMTDATSVVMNLYPKTFFYKKEFTEELGLEETQQFGLIAQEVEALLPNLVKEFETKSGSKFKSVNYNALIPVLVQALKEQKVRIDELETEVADYASLESRLNSIEEQLSSKSKNAKR